ncbi:MAG: hypothetical protein V4812_18030 [Pseudomonadota bacterium]
MTLPRTIKREIVDYLRLELGEDSDDPDTIATSQLNYVGSRKAGRSEIHFWEFMSGHRRRWATATAAKSGYDLGISEEGPSGETDLGAVPDAIYIDFAPTALEQEAAQSIKLPISEREAEEGFSTETPIVLPSGETFNFFVEVFFPTAEDESLDVSMEVSRTDDTVFYVRARCTTGMIFQCNLGGYNWSIQVGTGPWS